MGGAERQPVKDKNSDRNSQNNLFLQGLSGFLF